jgi:hypothetical protein
MHNLADPSMAEVLFSLLKPKVGLMADEIMPQI